MIDDFLNGTELFIVGHVMMPERPAVVMETLPDGTPGRRLAVANYFLPIFESRAEAELISSLTGGSVMRLVKINEGWHLQAHVENIE